MVTSKTAKADHQGRQDASRTLQEGRRWPQARESLKIAQEASKTVSKDRESLIITQEASKTASKRTKILSGKPGTTPQPEPDDYPE